MPRAVAVGLALFLAACGGVATSAPRGAAPSPSAAPLQPATPTADEDEKEDEVPAPRSATAEVRAYAAELRARRGDSAYAPPPRTKESACAARGPLPDPACTPGAVMTDDLAIICHEPTRRRRLVPTEVRHAVLASYGLLLRPSAPLEVDHLIPLELGGDNTVANLWPEAERPGDGFREKDRVEHYLHRQVCRGAMALRDAQRAIATDWPSVLRQLRAEDDAWSARER